MNQPILASQADQSLTYYTAEHGVAVRVGDTTDEGVLIENVDTGGRMRVDLSYPLLVAAPAVDDERDPAPPGGHPGTTPKRAAKRKTKKVPKAKAKRLACVTSLAANIQGGVKVDFPGRLILLLGDNGSQKTTITRGLELAGTASASDVAGRGITKKESMLIPLIDPAVDNAITSAMQVHLPSTDSTVECRYNAKVKDATHASKAEHQTSGLKVVFPLREVHANLRGSAEKAQAWLLKIACSDLDRAAVLARLPDSAATLFPNLNTGSIVQALLDALADAPSRASAAKRRAAESTSEADRLAAGLAPPASDEQIGALRSVADAAEALLEQAIAVNAASTATETVKQEDLDAVVVRLNVITADVRDRIDPLLAGALVEQGRLQPDPNLASKQADRAAGVRLFQKVLQSIGESCIFCAGDLPRTTQEAILSGLQGQMGAAVSADRERAERAQAVSQQIGALQNERALLVAEYGRLQQRGAALQTAQAAQSQPAQVGSVVSSSGTVVVPTEADARTARDLARQALNDAISRTESWSRSRAQRDQSATHASDQRTYEALAKELQATVAWAVDEAADTFAARVQSLLHKDDRFWLDARTGRYGLLKAIVDDQDRPIRHRRDSALCGAEWARVTLALAGAATPADADVAILVPEDRAWDAKTLRTALEGLASYPGMVVFTSTIKPYRGAPKGWHIVNTASL